MRTVAGLGGACPQCRLRSRLLAYQAFVLVGLVCGAGCGGSNLHPVRGKLVWSDGSAVTELAGGTILFESEKQDPHITARGEVLADGTFRLSTYKTHDGAPVGDYKVVVMQPAEDGNDSVMPRRKILHPKFMSTNTSGLKATVEPKSNDLTLTVERAPGARKGKG